MPDPRIHQWLFLTAAVLTIPLAPALAQPNADDRAIVTRFPMPGEGPGMFMGPPPMDAQFSTGGFMVGCAPGFPGPPPGGMHMHMPLFGPPGGMPPFAFAFGPPPFPPLPPGIQLSDEQVRSMAQQRDQTADKCAPIELELRTKHKAVMNLLAEPTIDEAKVRAVQAEVASLESRLSALRGEDMIAMAKILTPEQRRSIQLSIMRHQIGAPPPPPPHAPPPAK